MHNKEMPQIEYLPKSHGNSTVIFRSSEFLFNLLKALTHSLHFFSYQLQLNLGNVSGKKKRINHEIVEIKSVKMMK